MSLEAHQTVIRGLVTEKSHDAVENSNQYTFEVHPTATKHQIRDAVEIMFPSVKVLTVNTMNCSGKKKRVRFHYGTTKRWKKALVTLRPDDTLDFI